MSSSMLLGMFDWIGDFFKSLFDLIPKIMYLLYASLACVLDVFQLFFRKLAGLDVYYVDGQAVTGDLVTNFIAGIFGWNLNPGTENVSMSYSSLSTVFWSFIVFAFIILFISTLVAVIKSHYSYDEKAAKGPMQYVYTALKSVVNIVAVPIIVVLGLYLSQAILTALDTFTSTSSGTIVDLYGNDAVQQYLIGTDTVKSATGTGKEKTYIYYDLFGFGAMISYGTSDTPPESNLDRVLAKDLAKIGASNQTFSGSMFKVAAYNANRARIGSIRLGRQVTGTPGSGMELFKKAAELNDYAAQQELLAEMIDTAFACNLHLINEVKLNYDGMGGIVSWKYFTNFLIQNMSSFSKFNIGAVWYYYDLWNFNFIVGFATLIVGVSLFTNIILGLITRLFMCIGLFLIYPPLFALAPLDGGKAGQGWRENFMKQVLMAYGAVVGMNIFFIILPYFNRINFFNIPIADLLVQTLIIIVGLVTIKAFIAVISGLIGAADAHKEGDTIASDVGSVTKKAASATLGTAKIGAYASTGILKTVGKAAGVDRAAKYAGNRFAQLGNRIKQTYHESEAEANNDRKAELENMLANATDSSKESARKTAFSAASLPNKSAQETLVAAGYSKKQAKEMVKSYRKSQKAGLTTAADADTQYQTELQTRINEQSNRAAGHSSAATVSEGKKDAAATRAREQYFGAGGDRNLRAFLKNEGRHRFVEPTKIAYNSAIKTSGAAGNALTDIKDDIMGANSGLKPFIDKEATAAGKRKKKAKDDAKAAEEKRIAEQDKKQTARFQRASLKAQGLTDAEVDAAVPDPDK